MKTLKETWRGSTQVLQKAKKTQKKQAYKKRAPQTQPCKKLGSKYIEPFQIIWIINSVIVELQLSKSLRWVHPIFHCSLLKPFRSSGLRPAAEATPPILVKGKEHYEIKEILNSQYHSGKLHYLVLWRGYHLTDAKWVAATVVKAARLVHKFHIVHPDWPKWGRS